MNRQILDQAASMSAVQLSEAAPEFLQKVLIAATAEVTSAKKQLEHIEHAVDLRYARQAKALRLVQGKDTGVVHFDDGKVSVTADLPKKVEWDQPKLAAIVAHIRDSDDDPSQYVEISYRVSETKFNAWPETLKQPFATARTLKVGKPTYRLALLEDKE